MATPENNNKIVQSNAKKTAYGQRVSEHDLRTEGEIATPVVDNFKSAGGHMFRNTKNTSRANDIVVTHVHQKAGY